MVRFLRTVYFQLFQRQRLFLKILVLQAIQTLVVRLANVVISALQSEVDIRINSVPIAF